MTFEEVYKSGSDLRDEYSSFMIKEMHRRKEGGVGEEAIATLDRMGEELVRMEKPHLHEFHRQEILKLIYPVMGFLSELYDYLRRAQLPDKGDDDTEALKLLLSLGHSQYDMLEQMKISFTPFVFRHSIPVVDSLKILMSLGVDPFNKYQGALQQLSQELNPENLSLPKKELEDLGTRHMEKIKEMLEIISTPGFNYEEDPKSKEYLDRVFTELSNIESGHVPLLLDMMLSQMVFPVQMFEEKIFKMIQSIIKKILPQAQDSYQEISGELKDASKKFLTARDYIFEPFCKRNGIDPDKVIGDFFEKIDRYKEMELDL